MANQRTADLIINGFKDEMTTRRKYELKDSSGKNIAELNRAMLDKEIQSHNNIEKK